MYNRRYDRKTIILKQETDSFSKSAGQTAVAAIEIKNGTGRINLQGKAVEGSHVYLVGADRGSNICADLGQVGKTLFNPENVGDTARSIESFDIVVLGKRGNDGNFGSNAFVGFLNGRREWRKNIMTARKNEDKMQPDAVVGKSQAKVERPGMQEGKSEAEGKKLQIKEEQVQAENKALKPKGDSAGEVVEIKEFEPIAKKIKSVEGEVLNNDAVGKKEISPEKIEPLAKKILEMKKNKPGGQQEDIHDTFKTIVKNFNREMKNLEDIGVLSLSEVMDIQGVGSDDAQNRSVEATRRKESEVDYIFAHNEKMKPFKNEECEWVRICSDEIWSLGLKDNTINNSCFVLYADKKYKHLLLGKRESGMLVLGVPDCYKAAERRKALAMGFVDFFGVGDEVLREGAYGYWIKNLR